MYFVHKAHTFFHEFVHISSHAKGKFIQISYYLINILITDKKSKKRCKKFFFLLSRDDIYQFPLLFYKVSVKQCSHLWKRIGEWRQKKGVNLKKWGFIYPFDFDIDLLTQSSDFKKKKKEKTPHHETPNYK